jgi:hypothetical protein
MSQTEYNNYLQPQRRDIEDPSKIVDSVPTFIKNTAIRFLQIVYSQKPKGELKYSDNEEETEIKIADQYAFDLDAAHIRPAIIVVRGAISWNNIGLTHGMQQLDTKTGKTDMTGMLHSSVGFSCISRVGLEAEKIASDVFNLFKFFKTTLMKQGYFTIQSASMGPENLIEVAGEPKLFMVNVMMNCQVQDSWTLEARSAAELRKVVVSGLAQVKENDGIEF